MSTNAMPWPFCRWPVPVASVTSTKRFPSTFFSITFGISAANDGVPVPRYMSRYPSLSRSPKLAPIAGTTRSRPTDLVTSVKVPLPLFR